MRPPSIFRRRALLLSVLSATVTLSACGSSGGGSSHKGPEYTNPLQGPEYTNPLPNNPRGVDVGPVESFPKEWNQGATGQGVKVGVVDSSLDQDNPSHKGKINSYRRLTDGKFHKPFDEAPTRHGSAVVQAIVGNGGGVGATIGKAPNATVDFIGVANSKGEHRGLDGWTAARILAEEGSRVINASFSLNGYLGKNPPKARLESALHGQIYNLERIVDADALFIQSASNQSRDEPHSEAKVAELRPYLAKGYIVVAAVDSNTNMLASYSNACGTAQSWCMVADGSYLTATRNKDGTYSRWRHSGTSMAAPMVTATAANVLEKFPWMSNDNLRTTLLTTATDLGERGPDAVYGWGKLNAAKAMNGPAQFAFGDVTVDMKKDPRTYIWSNDISGEGGLIKYGAGTLNLTGSNTFAGDTVIHSGRVNVDGVTSSHAQVNHSGTLSGEGTVGSVLNNGLVINSGKGLNVLGDFTQSAKGVLASSRTATLDVGGTATLDGTLNLDAMNIGYISQSGEDVAIINAAKIKGDFSQVNDFSSIALISQLKRDENSLTANVRAHDMVDLAKRNKSASASTVIEGSASRLANLFDYLDDVSAQDSITPKTQSVLDDAAKIQASVSSADALNDALYSLSGAVYAHGLTVAALENSKAQSFLMSELSNTGKPGQTHAIMSHGYSNAKWNPEGLSATRRANTTIFGIQHQLNHQVTLAGAFVDQHVDWKESLHSTSGDKDRAKAKVKVQGFMLGGKYHFKDSGYYIKGSAGYFDVKNSVNRNLSIGVDTHGLQDTVRGSILRANVEIGEDWRLTDRFSLQSQIGMSFEDVRQKSVSESGHNLGLNIDAIDQSLWTANARVKGKYMLNERTELYAFMGVEHDLDERSFQYDAQFLGTPEYSHRNASAQFGSMRSSMGLGFRYDITENATIGMDYTFDRSASWKDHHAQASLKISF